MEDTHPGALTVNDVVTRVRQRPVLAVAPMMLGLLLSVAYVVLTPQSWAATASVKVEPVVADRYAGNVNVSNLISMQTEMQVVRSTEVAELAARSLGAEMRTVRRAITVDSPQDTQVVNITYAAGSAAGAVRGASTVARSYLEYSKKSKQAVAQAQFDRVVATIAETEKKVAVRKTATGLQDQVDSLYASRNSLQSLLANNAGEVINNPVPPSAPASPKPLVAIPAGIGLGTIAGLVLAVLWPSASRRRTTAPVPPRSAQPTPKAAPHPADAPSSRLAARRAGQIDGAGAGGRSG